MPTKRKRARKKAGWRKHEWDKTNTPTPIVPMEEVARAMGQEQFSTGAARSKVETISRTDLIPLEALLALGERYHLGAEHFGERNWQKGMPFANLLQHMQTHLQQLCHQLVSPVDLLGRPVEPGQKFIFDDDPRGNAAAIMWGAAAIIHFLAHGNPAEKEKS